MKLILAVDNNFSIGIKGDMLFHIKKDLQRFKDLTTGNIVIMGRKTLESLPGGKPLKNRIHIVLTSDKNYEMKDCSIVHSTEEIFEKVKEINPQNEKEVFLIGGGNLVAQLLDKCEEAYITKVDKDYKNFDTSIANLDLLENWKLVEKSEVLEENQGDENFSFTFNRYKNINI